MGTIIRDHRALGLPAEPARTRRPRAGALDLAIALSLALPAASAVAEEIAVRVRADGRVDVRVTAAPRVAVLDHLASQTGITMTYQGPAPRGTVSLEAYGANHAQAVLDVLEGLGVDYAATTNPPGTRILSLVVAGPAEPAGPHLGEPTIDPASTRADSGDPDAPAPTALSDEAEPADEPEAGGGASAGQELSPLPEDFVPGVRATGQPTEWGMPPFVLPDPADVTANPARPPPPEVEPASLPPGSASAGRDD
jgi:hypothetical protein